MSEHLDLLGRPAGDFAQPRPAADPAFLTPLVEEQSCGEWDDETIQVDVKMLSQAIRALLKDYKK